MDPSDDIDATGKARLHVEAVVLITIAMGRWTRRRPPPAAQEVTVQRLLALVDLPVGEPCRTQVSAVNPIRRTAGRESIVIPSPASPPVGSSHQLPAIVHTTPAARFRTRRLAGEPHLPPTPSRPWHRERATCIAAGLAQQEPRFVQTASDWGC